MAKVQTADLSEVFPSGKLVEGAERCGLLAYRGRLYRSTWCHTLAGSPHMHIFVTSVVGLSYLLINLLLKAMKPKGSILVERCHTNKHRLSVALAYESTQVF